MPDPIARCACQRTLASVPFPPEVERWPMIKARMVESGGNALAGSPADFGKLIADETEKWREVIRAANIKAE
jgi:hypothetical protein